MDGTSNPRPATLVATSTPGPSLRLKSEMVESRSSCSLPPCNDKDGYPCRNNCSNRLSARTCVSTNTSAFFLSSTCSPSSWSNRKNFSSSSTNSACCEMLSDATDRPPTMTSTGYFRDLRANVSTAFGNVAENRTVWRSGRTAARMADICGANPISYIRSASSMTTYVTRCNESSLPACIVKMSINRPGVATHTWTPRLRSEICSATAAPP
mmetsp:Transcript_23078/g.65409  ORF Transcript_23078/g.65409 Transcript_23078/m.65409 type:complete len:211 (-) Transcript_23078:1308-1940(-)